MQIPADFREQSDGERQKAAPSIQGIGPDVSKKEVMEQRVAENVQRAVAVLTAWNESDGGDTTLVDQVACDQLEEDGDPTRLVGGLVSLAGILLVRFADATGRSEIDILQELGRRSAVM